MLNAHGGRGGPPYIRCAFLAIGAVAIAACDGSIAGGTQDGVDDIGHVGLDGAVRNPGDAQLPVDRDGNVVGGDGSVTANDGGNGGGGGGTGPQVDRSNPSLHDFKLNPKEIDPAASQFLADGYASLDTRAAPLGKLVVFLPGHNNVPNDWHAHGIALASLGFHVVIPKYDNEWEGCSGQACGGKTRWEALTGEDLSSAISISRADSAEGRAIAMLKYLATNDPGGDWGYYLDGDDALHTEDVIIAGISHGSGSAAVYGMRRPVWRVVMHSGGNFDTGGWLTAPYVTPPEKFFALEHTADDTDGIIRLFWSQLKIPGAPTSVDGASAPYGGSHQLQTSIQSSYPHGSTCGNNSFSPKDANGKFVLLPAWAYMYGVDELTK
ncbi:MAG: hypothetical protein R3A78_16105 [Polyangiales bacterium]